MALFPTRLRRGLVGHLRDPVYANGYALVLNAGLSALLGFAFWVLAARRFPAAQLGFGAAVVSAATLAALVGKAGFDAALIRHLPSLGAREGRRLLAQSACAALALTLATAGVILLLVRHGLESLSALHEPVTAAGFVLLAGATVVAWMLDAFFVAHQAGSAVLLRNLAFNSVKLVVPIVAFASFATFAVPVAWGLGLAASLVVAFALLAPRLREGGSGAPMPPRREVLLYAGKNYALNLSEFLPGLVLPVLVLDLLGAEVNARFYLAWTVATIAFLAGKAISQSAFAALVRDASPRPALRKGLLLSALLLLPAALVLLVAAPFLLRLFGAGYGHDDATLLRLLALSIPPFALSSLYLAHLKARDAGWELTLLPTASLAVLLLAFPFALAHGGILGAGVVWLAVQTALGAYAGIRLIMLLRRNPNDAPRAALHRRAHQG